MDVRFAGLALPLLVIPALAALGQTPAPGDIQGVHLLFGPDPATGVRVVWTGSPDPTARVEYGTTVEYGQRAAATPHAPGGDSPLVLWADLEGLDPATNYHYRIVAANAASLDRNFTTAPRNASSSFVVTAWGDHGVPDAANPLSEADGDAPQRNVGLALAQRPLFHLFPGDLSYANGAPRTWDAYFRMTEPLFGHVPVMPVPGNHEREAAQAFLQYDARLPTPAALGERWYSYRVGPAVFVALDTEHACAGAPADDWVPGVLEASCTGGPNAAQLSFLEATLKKARADPTVRWIVAYHHYPIWSDGRHGSNLAVREIWQPLYDEYDVDLVVTAHDHLYERSRPLADGEPATNGTTYLVVGVGGASHYDFQHESPPEWEAARANDDYGVVVLRFGPDRLEGEFRALDGTLKDSWSVQKARPEDAPVSPSPAPAPTRDDDSLGIPAAGFLLAAAAVGVVALRVRLRRAP